MSDKLPGSIKKKKAAFVEFLAANGAEILTTTNEYEVLRFRANGETSVLYRNKHGEFTGTGEMAKAYSAFINGRKCIGAQKNKATIVKRTPKVRTLLERDGGNCFYCHEPLKNDITVEHLVSRAHGGPNHISNLVLAHQQCNADAGHLSAAEKIKLREQNIFGGEQ